MDEKKIAILYICIGDYEVFWKEFYTSFEEKFLKDCIKEYFVFTDKEQVYCENTNERIHVIYQENLGWPGNTLFRFAMFDKIAKELERFQYTFFFNSNIVCCKEVKEIDFLPLNNQLLVVQHYGYYNKLNYRYPYDREKKSSAYIPYCEGRYYVCGGVNGGKTESFLKLIRDLKNRIDADYRKKIIARWHDESQINKYIIENTDYRILSPSFCYPEGRQLPFEPILMTRDKAKWIELYSAKKNKLINLSWDNWRDKIVGLYFDIVKR